MGKERTNANSSGEKYDENQTIANPSADLKLTCDFPLQFSWSAYRSVPSYFPGGLSVANSSDSQTYRNIAISVSAAPHYFVSKTWRIAELLPGHRVTFSGRELIYNEALLNSLSGAPLQATVSFGMALETDNAEPTMLFQNKHTITLLAADGWSGTANMGELLPIFVRPQDGTIARIASDAMIRTRESRTVGYRHHSPAKIKALTEALFDVLDELSLNFVNQQCNYQTGHSIIAAPNEILRGKTVTSLDIALFFASLLESIELHPLIILYRQRALVGVWLKENLILDSLTMTRPEILRYQHRQDHLLVLDTRCLARRPAINFNQALQSGAMGIESESDSDFLGAYDIRLGRLHRIYPLGSDRSILDTAGFDPEKTLPLVQAQRIENASSRALSRALPDLLNLADSAPQASAGTQSTTDWISKSEDTITGAIKAATALGSPQEQLQYNRTRLLNLTPANPLLNLQESSGAITAVLADAEALLRHFSFGKEVHPISIDMWHTTPESAEYPPPTSDAPSKTTEAALANGHLFIDASEEDLHYSLRRLRHLVDYERQQTGVGSLYLVLNMVSWRQGNSVYMAPFILQSLSLVPSETHRGWIIRPVSSHLRLNGNLIELLRQSFKLDVSSLGPQLLTCAREGNLARASQLLSNALRDLPSLEVVSRTVIGSFPMGRFQIWRDLERMTPALQSQRLQSRIAPSHDLNRTEVRSMGLINGSALEEQHPISSMLLPWSCDTSQFEAIVQSNQGQDMVLLAPPGSGKNRTLADLICNNLAQGKKVLLVTKHRTTLSVVHRMLKKVGLSQFCLYMPSARIPDESMLDQLEQAWKARKAPANELAIQQHPFLQAHRHLTEIYESLHKRRSNGLTVHGVLSQAMKDNSKTAPAFTLSWPSSQAHDETVMRNIRKLVENLAEQKSKFSGPAFQNLRKLNHEEWSEEWQNALQDGLKTICRTNSSLEACIDRLWGALGCQINAHTTVNRKLSYELSELLISCAGHPVAFALESDAAQRLNMLMRMAMHADSYAQAEEQLSCPYAPLSWQNLAGRRLGERWRAAQTDWWPKCVFVKKKLMKEIKSGGAQAEPNIDNDAPLFDRLCSEAQEMEELNNAIRIPGLWHGFDTTAAEIQELEAIGSRLRNFVAGLSDYPELMVSLKSQLHTLLCEHPEALLPEGHIGQLSRECLELGKAMQAQQSELQQLSGINLDSELRYSEAIGSEINNLCGSLLKQTGQWKDWCDWCKGRHQATDLGLTPLLQAIDSGKVTAEQAVSQFQRAYDAWWIKSIVTEDSLLRDFNASDMAALLDQYRETEMAWRQATADIIASRVSAAIPDYQSSELEADWATLRAELAKTSNRKSAIQLWTEIPQAITELTPCLMMSPITVSQFLSSHMEPFDLAILAEASQLTVEEGLCAAARAKQVIAVGDPQQMPPLFDSCSGIEESILDVFIQSGAEIRGLQQHYHSKEESLIAYANHRYYRNSICTFPAPLYGLRDLSMAHIEGPFNSLTKTNIAEAQAVVRAIVYRLNSDDPTERQQSIGVITLSAAQQQLIEDMLAEEVQSNPQIAWAFDETQCQAPVIVRYLENSQGEYRDVIFLCITYGWDGDGQFAMDFGPLNKTYGSSLLNVAITRSREKMVVCANFHAQDIDLSRTQTPAIADLKEFLAFVETGYNEDHLAFKMEFPDDPLLSQVGEGLKSRGWQVHRHIGMSPTRIGLAVLNPDEDNRYLACIIGDGYMYRESRTTCERDLVRLKQLERLGWNILRVWSLDWWRHPDTTLDRLHQSLIKLLRNENARQRR
ncbi:DUF4011 domain-containing protein [bacterium]|nr:DUF4011 domain-containing protein [bacterium]